MDTFDTFGTTHLVALAVFAVGVWPAARVGRWLPDERARRRFSRGFALAIPAFTVPMQVIDFLPGQYDVDTTLPLQLCDLAWVAAVVALWTQHRYAVALTYYWGLLLTSQALVSPWLTADFPSPKFISYWGMHFLIVWAAIHLVWGLGRTPGWRDLASTILTTLLWAVSVFGFNLLAGTNYGFVNQKPPSGSILDYLGPWPAYLAVEVVLVAGAWALMTWPWVRREHRAGHSPGDVSC